MAINLYYSNGKVFVWDADDWMTLRTKYRVIGELIGSLSSHPRNEAFQGLPMVLMREEAYLLIIKEICQLIECDDLYKIPGDAQQKEYIELEKKIFSEQVDCMKQKRVDQISCRIDIIISGKRKKMASKGECLDFDRESVLKDELQKITPLTDANALFQIPTKHPWPSEGKIISSNVLEALDDSEHGKLKLSVYLDLWNKGYYVTGGTKFGGDYLIYPGDPVKFHATCVIKCLKCPDIDIEPSRLIALGRLGVSVNKLTVFAYLNKENTITYQTLQWYEALPE